MTEPLTIKGLNCENCPNATEIDGMDEYRCSIYNGVIGENKLSVLKVCGCASHPLALRVLAQPVVTELERRIKLARPIPRNGKRIEVLKEAHALVGGDVKA